MKVVTQALRASTLLFNKHRATVLYLKVLLILTAAFSNHIALTSPEPPASTKEIARGLSSGQHIFHVALSTVPPIVKSIVWAACLSEAATILASHNATSVATQGTLSALSWTSTQDVKNNMSPIFLLGWALSVSGGLVRLSCYRTLGRFFTFEVAVRPKHRLITTGPYAWVRHPSYTAGITETAGNTICLFHSGSWVRESGVLGTRWGSAIACVLWIWDAYLVVSVCRRMPQEDQILRKHFGKQWDDWATKVPYRLMPGTH